jgi:hypothetical protein
MVVLSLICLVSGVVSAGVASQRPQRQAVFESVGGGLLIGGLCLLGAGLPLFR